MKTIHDLKCYLKSEASAIRTLKSSRKSHPNGWVPGLNHKRYMFRLKHVAYCLIRGRRLDEVETNRKLNPPDSSSWLEKAFQVDLESTLAELKLTLGVPCD